MSIINRVVEYLKKHAEFEANNSDDEVRSKYHLLCGKPERSARSRARWQAVALALTRHSMCSPCVCRFVGRGDRRSGMSYSL